MIEKVNPQHPDKVADRVAGAIVDLAYKKQDNPKIAVEALLGHGKASIISETSVHFMQEEIEQIVHRIAGNLEVTYHEVPQDPELAKNQDEKTRAGDNGIFKGVPVSEEVQEMSRITKELYEAFPTDGKYILDGDRLIVSQSYATDEVLEDFLSRYTGKEATYNPLGYWTGGLDVDSGAVNRKLGSDMGEAVTGGGLHGKDVSKADVSVNIYAHIKAQETGEIVRICCAIGDETVDGKPYDEIVKIAKDYIDQLGGFEKLAEWGLV